MWLSLVVIAAAAWLWNGRMERRHEMRLAKMEKQSQRDSQYAAGLLFRAFHADNYLTYSALSKTTARMGQSQIGSVARIVHAPRRLAIAYLEGDYAGLHSGYNEHWAWRQVGTQQPMIPYAEMERPATDMAARRFALLLQNYEAIRRGNQQIKGRNVEVVELRPFQPAPGAEGPAKKLWIDADTGLTIRQQTFNYQLMPVMQSVLTQVNLAPQITEDTFVPPQRLQAVAQQRPWMAKDTGSDIERVAQMTGLYPPQPQASALPTGFAFDSVGVHRRNPEDKAAEQSTSCYAALSRYTDGLNTLTLFALPFKCAEESAVSPPYKNATPAKAAPTNEKMQSCAYGAGTVVMRDVANGQLIAVADLPEPVLRRVLESTSIRLYNSR